MLFKKIIPFPLSLRRFAYYNNLQMELLNHHSLCLWGEFIKIFLQKFHSITIYLGLMRGRITIPKHHNERKSSCTTEFLSARARSTWSQMTWRGRGHDDRQYLNRESLRGSLWSWKTEVGRAAHKAVTTQNVGLNHNEVPYIPHSCFILPTILCAFYPFHHTFKEEENSNVQRVVENCTGGQSCCFHTEKIK